jgi:flagellar motor switch protein FliG
VSLTGKQKAAVLLMSLDVGTATELLKGIDAKMVQELAVELRCMDTASYRSSKQGLELVRQFCNLLEAKRGLNFRSLLTKILKTVVGNKQARHIEPQMGAHARKHGPFFPICSADSRTIASILEDEHPQVAAVVLAELPPEKSAEVLSLLREGIQLSAISRMSNCDTVTAEEKSRIAETVCRRLEPITDAEDGAVGDRPAGFSGKVPVILQNSAGKLQDDLSGRGDEEDGEIAAKAATLMVWRDIAEAADASLREALRGIEAKRLAVALVEADEAISNKIRSNISEEAAAMVDEEALLISAPEKEEVEGAREEIVKVLRELNGKVELAFMEDLGDVGYGHD